MTSLATFCLEIQILTSCHTIREIWQCFFSPKCQNKPFLLALLSLKCQEASFCLKHWIKTCWGNDWKIITKYDYELMWLLKNSPPASHLVKDLNTGHWLQFRNWARDCDFLPYWLVKVEPPSTYPLWISTLTAHLVYYRTKRQHSLCILHSFHNLLVRFLNMLNLPNLLFHSEVFIQDEWKNIFILKLVYNVHCSFIWHSQTLKQPNVHQFVNNEQNVLIQQ